MRYLVIAAGLGVVGVVAAGLTARAIGTESEPFSTWWLVLGVILPVFGVVYGPLAFTYYLQSRRVKLRPTAEGAHSSSKKSAAREIDSLINLLIFPPPSPYPIAIKLRRSRREIISMR